MCCVVFVVCSLSIAVCGMLFVVACTLLGFCCVLSVACCVSTVVRLLLFVVRCSVFGDRCMVSVVVVCVCVACCVVS